MWVLIGRLLVVGPRPRHPRARQIHRLEDDGEQRFLLGREKMWLKMSGNMTVGWQALAG